MGLKVVAGAMLQCSFGVAPSTLSVLPLKKVTASSMPLATIMDFAPMVNIMPFGMCTSLANPTVATATTAALGVLVPMPCIPMTVAPWAPGDPTSMIANTPALSNDSTCNCGFGGVIKITMPGQFSVKAD